jgi:hypothetical protein
MPVIYRRSLGEPGTKRFALTREFISLISVKETNQSKRFPRQGKPVISLARGFFDSPSMARSKNGAHPVRRPMGLASLSTVLVVLQSR